MVHREMNMIGFKRLLRESILGEENNMWEKAKGEKVFKKLVLFLNRKGAWLEY